MYSSTYIATSFPMSFANMGQNRRGGLLGTTQLLHPTNRPKPRKSQLMDPVASAASKVPDSTAGALVLPLFCFRFRILAARRDLVLRDTEQALSEKVILANFLPNL
jgi:hypothetical protein